MALEATPSCLFGCQTTNFGLNCRNRLRQGFESGYKLPVLVTVFPVAAFKIPQLCGDWRGTQVVFDENQITVTGYDESCPLTVPFLPDPFSVHSETVGI